MKISQKVRQLLIRKSILYLSSSSGSNYGNGQTCQNSR